MVSFLYLPQSLPIEGVLPALRFFLIYDSMIDNFILLSPFPAPFPGLT